jgi:ssDNA-binding Zn-finger/Zn-ribbon topoisomerase 1
MAHPQRKLRLVHAREYGYPRNMPPVPDVSSDTMDLLCGNCGTLLMHISEGQVHGVFIHCTECGACNASDL